MRKNFCPFLSFNAAPYFQLKKPFHIYFFMFIFINYARKSCAPFTEIIFPMTFSSMESSPNISPSSQAFPPNQKIPLKRSIHFPITITICSRWSKFVTCSPSYGDCGRISRPQRHTYKVFQLR